MRLSRLLWHVYIIDAHKRADSECEAIELGAHVIFWNPSSLGRLLLGRSARGNMGCKVPPQPSPTLLPCVHNSPPFDRDNYLK